MEISSLTHQILQCEAHQFLLQSFYQRHLDRLGLILRLTVGAEPLRQHRPVLRKLNPNLMILQMKKSSLSLPVVPSLFSSYLCDRRVLAEVEVTAEITLVANDFRQDVGVTGVTELGVL